MKEAPGPARPSSGGGCRFFLSGRFHVPLSRVQSAGQGAGLPRRLRRMSGLTQVVTLVFAARLRHTCWRFRSNRISSDEVALCFMVYRRLTLLCGTSPVRLRACQSAGFSVSLRATSDRRRATPSSPGSTDDIVHGEQIDCAVGGKYAEIAHWLSLRCIRCVAESQESTM